MRYILLAFLFAGCASTYQSQTEITEHSHSVPALHASVDTVIQVQILPSEPSICDSAAIGYEWLLRYCKGVVPIEQNGLIAKITFFARQNDSLSRENDKLYNSAHNFAAALIDVNTELEAKEHLIQTLDTAKVLRGYTKADIDSARLSGQKWGALFTVLSLIGICTIFSILAAKFGWMAEIAKKFV